ncbi:hypothetical protein [Sinisalibacter aestuarii]|uniref:hypothetical protein n=1 Tax=Sinisalibacter aestuarii TaxID=2949426 RepID=UPI002490C232|nr:hypothetical protein [Sinisalibacter aestuarii]
MPVARKISAACAGESAAGGVSSPAIPAATAQACTSHNRFCPAASAEARASGRLTGASSRAMAGFVCFAKAIRSCSRLFHIKDACLPGQIRCPD